LEEPDIELRKLGAAALTGLTGVKKLHNDFDQGLDYYVYAPIPSIGYSLILAINEAEVLAPVARVIRLMLIVLIISILFLFVLVYVLSKKLSLPVANMSKAIRDFDPEGKSTITLESNIDEFRELIKSFESKADNVMQSARSKNEQLKQAFDQLNVEKQTAEQANRAKSDFLANMSHEIRTPMNAINGMADLCLLTNLDETQKGYLTKLKSAGGALLGLLNDILDFSKIEAGKLEIEKTRFDLAELLSNIANIVSITAEEKGIEFIIHTDITIPNILIGDHLRLNQILINLCSNAVKFTDKGEVRLDVTVSRHEANNIELKFSVKDSGIGIPEEKLSHLFEEFYQTDSSSTRKYGGTGLGLAISQKLTNIMKGNMSVASHYGKGSTFVADIPFGVKDSCVDYTKHSVQLNGKRILVVDDNASVREIYCAMLRYFNCEVDSAINGQTAIDKCLSQQYDLLILDWNMPDFDGIETYKRLQSSLDTLPKVIMASAHAHERIRNEARSLGISEFLTKPIMNSVMFEAISKVLLDEPVTNEATSPEEVDSLENLVLPEKRGARILVVDDVMINREIAKGLLVEAGFKVTCAVDGKAALEMVSNLSFDLVLMDIQMPVMDGYESTKCIRSIPEFESLPILAMTANAMKGDREKCLDAGMNDHIPKPIELEHLITKLNQWL